MTDEHKKTLKKALGNVVAIVADTSGWTLATQQADPYGSFDILYEKPMPGSAINCFLVTSLLGGKPEDLAKKVYSWGLEEWNAFANDLDKFDVVDTFTNEYRVIYQVNKMPWPIWARDSCMLNGYFVENNKHYIISISTVYSKCPENPTQYVRATVLHSAFIFEQDKDDKNLTRFIRLLQVDPNGSIPNTLVNTQSRSLLQIPSKVRAMN